MLFILEEDASYFSFKERFSLAFIGTRAYSERVSVLPSTEYIVSKETFPDYFIKEENDKTEAFAEYDALIFKKYFMEKLGISKRYFGTEESAYMQIYNAKMKEVLGDKAEIIDRFSKNDKVISAKKVRKLIEEGKIDEAMNFIPTSNRSVMKMILSTKNVKR
jgi:[citrate (pro-3S)-lyase] ligase